ncbi:hypothetical protein RhiirC2_801091 [Rhizophagus irregularis]|uniref:Uncharacterized protein n=1 Tax=Rhizophagus irregularis TaxID=588596 RepID=A0A2N1M2W1_9GLOM|nr:hypothetical protein RhiirC2_801091 [Rhizophagus irregularis]
MRFSQVYTKYDSLLFKKYDSWEYVRRDGMDEILPGYTIFIVYYDFHITYFNLPIICYIFKSEKKIRLKPFILTVILVINYGLSNHENHGSSTKPAIK